jgi:diguanylate cyclase (GGDEF)-like protein
MSTVEQKVSPSPEVLEAIIAVQHEAAAGGLGLDQVMRLVALRSQGLAGGTGAMVEMADEHGLACRVATGSLSSHAGQRLPTDALSMEALRTGRVRTSDDTSSDPLADGDAFGRLGVRSLVAVPIRATGFAGGLLKVVSDRPGAFTPADARAAELLGGVVVAAVARSSGHDVRSRQDLLDPLTGLANRTLFLDRLGAALRRLGRRRSTLAVLFVDLDGFQEVNEHLGRAVGDRLLVAAAGRIREVVRGTDTVARLGGDDFGLVCEDAGGPRGAAWVAERLLEWLNRPFRIDGNEVRVGATIGIAVADRAGGDQEELLCRASQAMYAAKSDGRGRYRFAEPVSDD